MVRPSWCSPADVGVLTVSVAGGGIPFLNHGKHKTPEQIVALLQKASQRMAPGEQAPDICRGLGISESSFYGWRTRYHGMTSADAKRVRSKGRRTRRSSGCWRMQRWRR